VPELCTMSLLEIINYEDVSDTGLLHTYMPSKLLTELRFHLGSMEAEMLLILDLSSVFTGA
jgi:hypothetical protein